MYPIIIMIPRIPAVSFSNLFLFQSSFLELLFCNNNTRYRTLSSAKKHIAYMPLRSVFFCNYVIFICLFNAFYFIHSSPQYSFILFFSALRGEDKLFVKTFFFLYLKTLLLQTPISHVPKYFIHNHIYQYSFYFIILIFYIMYLHYDIINRGAT